MDLEGNYYVDRDPHRHIMYEHYSDLSELFCKLIGGKYPTVVTYWICSDEDFGKTHDYGLHILWTM